VRSGPVRAKICGLKTPETVEAAVTGGASHVGFVFFPRSPRAVEPQVAGRLAASLPETVTSVGVFVDPDDALLESVLADVPLGMLQLHGAETPERVAAVRARTGRPVMKAVAVSEPADLDRASEYLSVADWLLFDAKPPKDENALPGGNGLAFEWRLLHGVEIQAPWMLSGGLTPENVAEAVRVSGATHVDVSSGVEEAPGRKSAALIRDFLGALAPIRR